MTSAGAETFDITQGLIANFERDLHPTRVYGWRDGELSLSGDATHFGIVIEGHAQLRLHGGEYRLPAGFYFSVPSEASLGGLGRGMVVSRVGSKAFFDIGGPVEQYGRLKYIDGCSDSLLISPVVMGDPCLNFLSIPPGVDQTEHTHPSIRVGVVISGNGICRAPAGVIELRTGRGFILHRDAPHSFHTLQEGLRIIVYHPDSDFGPTHDYHPMINRTYVNGACAAGMQEIRTR